MDTVRPGESCIVVSVVIKQPDRAILGKGRVYSMLQHSGHTPLPRKSGQEIKARLWRQDLMQKLWRNTAY